MSSNSRPGYVSWRYVVPGSEPGFGCMSSGRNSGTTRSGSGVGLVGQLPPPAAVALETKFEVASEIPITPPEFPHRVGFLLAGSCTSGPNSGSLSGSLQPG